MRVTVVKKNKKNPKSTSFLLQIHLIFNELGSQLCCFFFLHLLLSFKRRPHTKNARALQENKQKQCLCSGFCCQTYSHRAPAAAQPVVCVCVCVWRKVREVTDETDSDSGNSTFLQQPLATVSEADWEKNVKNSPQIPKEKRDHVDISGLRSTFSW